MKKFWGIFFSLAVAFILGFGTNSFAVGDTAFKFKVAYVDTNIIFAKSSSLQSLKKEQENKIKELERWLSSVDNEVLRQPDSETRQKLSKQYNDEFEMKKNLIRKEYGKKLKAIDDEISAVIEEKAKEGGYSLVLSKSVVLYGGDDITEQIAALIK